MGDLEIVSRSLACFALSQASNIVKFFYLYLQYTLHRYALQATEGLQKRERRAQAQHFLVYRYVEYLLSKLVQPACLLILLL
jgi:hypothetical protein